MVDISTDLIWDHAGERLDDTIPFVTGDGQSHFDRSRNHEGVNLSYHQTLQLIQNLEETNGILQSYLHDIDDELDKTNSRKEDLSSGSGPVTRLKDQICYKCQSLLGKVTGAKAVLFTVFLQAVNVLIQTVIDFLPQNKSEDALDASCAAMIILQLLNLLLILFTSAKLARQMFNHQISGIFLLQSYIATLLLFAGLYTITKRLKPSSWKYFREDVEDPVYIAVIYCKFLYFSVSIGSLCGNTDVTPYDWYNCVFVSIQMLTSFMYFASILGHACMPLQSAKRDKLLSPLKRQQTINSLLNSSLIPTPNDQSDRLLNSQYTGYGSTNTENGKSMDEHT